VAKALKVRNSLSSLYFNNPFYGKVRRTGSARSKNRGKLCGTRWKVGWGAAEVLPPLNLLVPSSKSGAYPYEHANFCVSYK
jgi:hypothetical protein